MDEGKPDFRPRDWAYPACVFLVFGLAVALRLSEIPFGEPFMIHVDEPNFVRRALNILVSGDANPHWFGHPGTLTIYNLSAVYAVRAFLQGAPLEGLLAEYALDPAPFHALGKHVIVFWSLLGHLGLWLLSRQFVSKWFALLAVLLMATTEIDVEIGSLIRTDTQQSALLILLCLCLVRALRSGHVGWFASAGALLGMATAVKWPSVVACFSIALVALLSGESKKLWPLVPKQLWPIVLAAAASALALLLVAPHIYLDFQTVLHNVETEAREYHLSATSPGFFAALFFYLRLLFSSTSLLGVVLSLVGVVMALRSERWREAVAPVSLFVVYLVFISAQNLRWDRWSVPLVPYVCLFVAMGAAQVVQLASIRLGESVRACIVTGLLILALGLGAGRSAATMAQEEARPDARVAATRFIATHVPAGARVLSELYAPYVPGTGFRLYGVDRRTGKLKRVTERTRYVSVRGHVGELKDVDATLKKLDYVLVGPYHKRLRAEPKRHKAQIKTYDRVFKETRLVKKFGSLEIRKVKGRKPRTGVQTK